MSLGEVIASGGKLWVDETLQLRFDGPSELLPAIREHKESLRLAAIAKEWRDRCEHHGKHSDYGAQWRDLAALPGRLAFGLDIESARKIYQTAWDLARNDLRVLSGSELAACALRVFPGSRPAP